jgi:hypothetical protein
MSVLMMWVIYDHPRDRPDSWVARKWVFDRSRYMPTSEVLTAAKLDTLRAGMVQRGLVCLARDATDDPCIVEAWI